MKLLTIILLIILTGLSLFTLGHLLNQKFLIFNNQGAVLSRFVEPREFKSFDDSLEKISSEPADFSVLAKNGQSVIYYNGANGYLHLIEDPDGDGFRDKKLQRLHPYLKDFKWSGDKSIVVANNGAENIYYNLLSDTSRALPRSVRSVSFPPFHGGPAYLNVDPDSGKASIGISDMNFESFKKLLNVAEGDWSISWLNKDTLAIAYANGGKTNLLSLAISTGYLGRIFSNQENFEMKVSPDGKTLLYSSANQDGVVSTFYKKIQEGNSIKLPVKTPASKCVWSIDNRTIYCVVSESVASDQKDDQFVSMDLASLEVKKLKINNTIQINTDGLVLSADEKSLFFINHPLNRLYRLKIEL